MSDSESNFEEQDGEIANYEESQSVI